MLQRIVSTRRVHWITIATVSLKTPSLTVTIMFYFVFAELGGLLKFVRPFLISISKAKAARLVRSLLDLFLDMEAATGQEVELCLECIEWAKAEKRTFLRQALEVTAVYMLTFRKAAWMSGILTK